MLFSSYIILNKSFIKLWVDESNYISLSLTILLAIAIWSLTAQTYVYNLILAFGKFKKSSIIILLESIFRVCLMFLLTHYFKINGVPMAILVTTFISFLILFAQLRTILKDKNISLPTISMKKILHLFIISGITIFLHFNVSEIINSWLDFIISGVTLITVFSVLIILFNNDIKNIFLNFLSKLYNKNKTL